MPRGVPGYRCQMGKRCQNIPHHTPTRSEPPPLADAHIHNTHTHTHAGPPTAPLLVRPPRGGQGCSSFMNGTAASWSFPPFHWHTFRLLHFCHGQRRRAEHRRGSGAEQLQWSPTPAPSVGGASSWAVDSPLGPRTGSPSTPSSSGARSRGSLKTHLGEFRQLLPLRPPGGSEAASLTRTHGHITGFVLRLHEAPGPTDGGFGTLFKATDICETAAAGVWCELSRGWCRPHPSTPHTPTALFAKPRSNRDAQPCLTPPGEHVPGSGYRQLPDPPEAAGEGAGEGECVPRERQSEQQQRRKREAEQAERVLAREIVWVEEETEEKATTRSGGGGGHPNHLHHHHIHHHHHQPTPFSLITHFTIPYHSPLITSGSLRNQSCCMTTNISLNNFAWSQSVVAANW